ncbi:hypothetical protein GUJ93_ZPchr0010g9025 [Zizania palustris]|uniref:PORR domain-containing protein n=1 Tax=Zizania palustris TaxID=103762 RepID=A0A8J5W9T9_ZIZPA|nr:hypothetical protein GUJ93_ZPchr0010g9025 [Zizania palustris]
MFYVSLKGDRDSVFLREAYKNSQLVDKSKLVLLKEKMRALVAVPRFARRRAPTTSEEADGTNGAAQMLSEGSDVEDDEDVGLSDMEDLISEISGGKSDADYHWGDGWVGENGDSPPDFEHGDDSRLQEVKVTMKNTANSANGNAHVHPVFPDGRPRELWLAVHVIPWMAVVAGGRRENVCRSPPAVRSCDDRDAGLRTAPADLDGEASWRGLVDVPRGVGSWDPVECCRAEAVNQPVEHSIASPSSCDKGGRH